MKTTVNNNNIESKNGMSQVIIDLRPQVKQQDGHGREVLADVHFRIDVRAYSANLYTYTQEAREESIKAVTAYDREIVELLTAEGWMLKTENYGPGECPELVKGTQYLYCHPQDISGQVNPADIETLEAKIKAMTTCKYLTTDNYGDIIVTTSEADEKQLYRDTYADGLAAIWQEVITTKRSNLYKDKGEAEHCVRRRICIANRRADLNDIGTGCYNMRTPLLEFLMEEYDRLLKNGYIKEADGANGRTLCRWINKREEKERAKAIREAEKAAKTKAQQEQEREAATLEATSEITDTLKAGDFVTINSDGRPAVVVRVVAASDSGPAMVYLNDWSNWPTDSEGVNVVCTPDDVTPITSDMLQPKAPDTKDDYKPGDRVRHNLTGREATVTAIRVTKDMKAYGDLRKVYRLDFGQSVVGPFDVELNGAEFMAEALTELLPEPPAEVTLEDSGEITDENEAARLLAGRAACYVTTDKDGRETLRQFFSFRDTFQNRSNRIWFDITEKSYALGCYIMFQYDVIKELANTGRVIVNNSNGETNTITLAA